MKKAIIISLVFLVIIFLVHLFYPSLLNGQADFALELGRFDNEFMAGVVDLHASHPAFAGRFITTSLITILAEAGFDYVPAFVFINFFFLFLSGILIYKISLIFHKKQDAIWSLILFFLSFSIFFAFFRSIDTYDDPIQYFCLLFSLYFLYKNKFYWFLSLFFVSLFARETGLLLIPAILYWLYISSKSKKELAVKYFYIFFASGLFFIAEFIFLHYKNLTGNLVKYTTENRFSHLLFNFQNFNFTVETILSAFLVLALPVIIIFAFKKRCKNKIEKNIIKMFVISLVINTIIVIFLTRAREARLFALPLLFVWPFLGAYVRWFFIKSLKYIKHPKAVSYFVLTLFFILFNYLLSFEIYKPTYAGGFEKGFQIYLFLYNWLIWDFFFLLKKIKKKHLLSHN